MRRTIYIICVVYFAVGALFAFREDGLLQIFFMLSLLALFVSFILSVIHPFRAWSQLRWRVFFPLVMCMVSFFVGPMLGRFVRDAYFRRQIPQLQAATVLYRSTGQMPKVHWAGHGVFPRQTDEKDTIVEFLWGVGFPVKHTALVYASSDDPKTYFRAKGLYYGYRLQDHWWVMQD